MCEALAALRKMRIAVFSWIGEFALGRTLILRIMCVKIHSCGLGSRRGGE